ncbi:LysR family transcriptional regulator [uncultured Serinicoccus sp.]|uniref:LysR family transcriptional regulator n=1 Tax=uncultured Serinicoccus sp. TaxID=735514 RepID=UPI002613CB37|nr:LysR family transcriptional regulator [uncultured Serinicoccus sp.]
MSITLKQLTVLVAVVEHEGFGAAASALGVDQSSVSHSIAALEKVAGASLVTRASPLRPTELGRALLPHARTAVASTRAIESLVSAHQQQPPTGTVRVAASPTVSHRMLPRMLKQWTAALPGVEVRLFEGDDDELDECLSSGVVDCAILIDPTTTPPGALELLRERFCAVVRTDHPFSGLEEVGLPDLLDDPLLVSAGGCEPQIRDLHTRCGVRYEPAQRVREISTLLSMVENDIGVAIMPSLATTLLPDTLTMVDLTPELHRRLVLTGPLDRPWHPQVANLVVVAATELAA